MNRDTTKSLHERLITFSLLTPIVVLFATGPMWASTLVVNSSTTTEIISVPRFNQQASQGWLTGVNLRINLQSSSIVGSVGSHNHSLSNPFHVGGTTSSSGIHNHAVNIPTFSGGGLAVQPVGNFNVNSDGLHNHSVNSGALATNSSGAHNHTHSTQTRVHTFSGAGMAPFLGSGTFGLTGSLSSTANVGTHIHSYTVGVNSAGAHSHGYTDRWTTNTTFTFDPNDAPTANANGAYNLIYGNNLTLSGVGSFDPDIPFGDFITQYQWDLDNNSSPNFTTSSPIPNLTEAGVPCTLWYSGGGLVASHDGEVAVASSPELVEVVGLADVVGR